MELPLLNIRVTSSVVMIGAVFFLASSILNPVQSHHLRGIPGYGAGASGDPCACQNGGYRDYREIYGTKQTKLDDYCESNNMPIRNERNHTCPVNPVTGKLNCSNDDLRCPGNRERCCLANGICGCPDPCDASKCRPVGSTWLAVHGVSVVSMSSTEIRQGETSLKCDPLSNSLMCCKNSICSKLPEVVVTPKTMNTFDGAICSSDGRNVLQYYANVTEVIRLWAFGRERYGKETDGVFGDLVSEVIEKLLGRTPNNFNLPFII